MTKLPPPPTRAAPAAPPPEPERKPRPVGPVRLTISGDVTIPAVPGYARRLANLIADLKRSVEEQAPWLANVEIEVERDAG